MGRGRRREGPSRAQVRLRRPGRPPSQLHPTPHRLLPRRPCRRRRTGRRHDCVSHSHPAARAIRNLLRRGAEAASFRHLWPRAAHRARAAPRNREPRRGGLLRQPHGRVHAAAPMEKRDAAVMADSCDLRSPTPSRASSTKPRTSPSTPGSTPASPPSTTPSAGCRCSARRSTAPSPPSRPTRTSTAGPPSAPPR